MLCIKLATRKDGHQFPCGQCKNCKINKRRDWQARLLLEAASHEFTCFATLTFADVGTPVVLSKNHLKVFFRALRQAYSSLRHYSVGEYGTRTGRAHYHTHLFSDVFLDENVIRKCWPYGHIHLGDTEPASLDYCLGYLLKDPKVIRWPIEARFPEFRMFSKGVGKFAFPHLLIDGTELPREFKVFGKKWPIGRYLRDRAKKMGFTVSEREEVILERLEAQAMRSVLSGSETTSEEITAAYEKLMKDRQEKLQKLRNKAIRDAYRQDHGHLKREQHETF